VTTTKNADNEQRLGDLAVARIRNPQALHILGKSGSLCTLWAASKLTAPSATKAQRLPLCHTCQRIQEKS
jgi:hypothetical protein